MNVPPHVSSAALWGRALLALRVARPAALALALAIAPSAALAEGGALMRARAIECRLDAFTQCGAWFRACETRRASDESKEERLRFDLALKRIEMHHAKGVWRMGDVVEDRVEAGGRIIVAARRPETRERALVFRIAPGGALSGTGDDGRFALRGHCAPA